MLYAAQAAPRRRRRQQPDESLPPTTLATRRGTSTVMRLTTRSGNYVSPVALGGGTADHQREASLISSALNDHGVNCFFWPPLPGVVAGEFAAGMRELAVSPNREEVFLIGCSLTGTRVPGDAELTTFAGRTAEGVQQDLATCMRQLGGSRYIDAFIVQYVQPEEDFDAVLKALAEAQRSKERGNVRYVGASTHSFPLARRLIECGMVDVLMLRYNMAHTRGEREAFDFAIGTFVSVSPLHL